MKKLFINLFGHFLIPFKIDKYYINFKFYYFLNLKEKPLKHCSENNQTNSTFTRIFLPAECRRMATRATRRTDMRSFMSFDREKRVPLWRSTIQWCLTFPGLALYKRKRAALRTQSHASAYFVVVHFIIFAENDDVRMYAVVCFCFEADRSAAVISVSPSYFPSPRE